MRAWTAAHWPMYALRYALGRVFRFPQKAQSKASFVVELEGPMYLKSPKGLIWTCDRNHSYFERFLCCISGLASFRGMPPAKKFGILVNTILYDLEFLFQWVSVWALGFLETWFKSVVNFLNSSINYQYNQFRNNYGKKGTTKKFTPLHVSERNVEKRVGNSAEDWESSADLGNAPHGKF